MYQSLHHILQSSLFKRNVNESPSAQAVSQYARTIKFPFVKCLIIFSGSHAHSVRRYSLQISSGVETASSVGNAEKFQGKIGVQRARQKG
jgi:hypothetical protein